MVGPVRSHHDVETSSRKAGKQKKCSRCGQVQPICEFGTNASSIDGHQSYCRACKSKLKSRRQKTDVLFRLRHHITTRSKSTLKDKTPADLYTNLEHYLGYKLYELKRQVSDELRERMDMSFIEAIRNDFHLDHIRPLSSFKLTEIDSEDGLRRFRECWHPSNLKLIPAKQNLRKGAKAVEDLDFDYGL